MRTAGRGSRSGRVSTGSGSLRTPTPSSGSSRRRISRGSSMRGKRQIRHMSTIAQVPPYHLLGQIANLSAEALAAARDGLDRKIGELQGILSEPHKQTLRLAGLAAGNKPAWDDRTSTVVWRDTSARAFAATADALGKVAQMLGVPATELWSRIPGVSAEEVARWKQVAESQGALAELNRMLETSMTKGWQTTGPPTRPSRSRRPALGRTKRRLTWKDGRIAHEKSPRAGVVEALDSAPGDGRPHCAGSTWTTLRASANSAANPSPQHPAPEVLRSQVPP